MPCPRGHGSNRVVLDELSRTSGARRVCGEWINPAQAHHFAKALLKRAKTEAIDAQTLAQLAMVLQPEPWTPPPQIYSALQQRLAQRDDLLNLRQQVRNQRHALVQYPEVIPEVRVRMDQLLATFEAQLAEVESEIAAALTQDAVWAAAAERLQSIKGVGWVTAAWTLVTTLHFTSCDTVDARTAYTYCTSRRNFFGDKKLWVL